MTHNITEPCINVKDKSCVEACPVDCIHEGPDQFFINPNDCIDCTACVQVCPVEAIYAEADTPEKWKGYTEKNAAFFKK